MSILSHVRDSAEWVMSQACHVRINEDKISGYAAFLIEAYPLVSVLDDEHHLNHSDPAVMASYVLALDTLNFGSAYYSEAQEAGIPLRYYALSSALKKSFESGRYCSPSDWVHVQATDIHALFDIPTGKSPVFDALALLYAAHLREMGSIIVKHYDGDIYNLIHRKTADELVGIVAEWPNFRDIADYHGRPVPILKRAQIFAADLNLAMKDHPDWQISASEHLTCFADNIVPHVLHHDGIISYTPELANIIASRTPLASGSEEETELRCAAIHLVERIKHVAITQGHAAVTSVNIDHMLWHRGQEPDIYRHPTHRTRSIFY